MAKASVAGKGAVAEKDRILKPVRALKEALKEKEEAAKDGVDDAEWKDLIGHQVTVQDDSQVKGNIEALFVYYLHRIMKGEGLSITVPSRSSGNQMYIKELDRIVLKKGTSTRSMSNVATVRKTAITMRVLELIHEIVAKNIHITKRDLFYTDVKLFQKQTESDVILDDTACLLGCTRTSLNGKS